MAPHPGIDTGQIKEKARKDLLDLLEGVCKAVHPHLHTLLGARTECKQVRGKKNLVIERALAGPIGLFVKFSTLQEYGVDKVFFLENDNVDSSQRSIIFMARGENAVRILAIAGEFLAPISACPACGQSHSCLGAEWISGLI
jgi:vacuolar protein sorting-associated protein 33A